MTRVTLPLTVAFVFLAAVANAQGAEEVGPCRQGSPAPSETPGGYRPFICVGKGWAVDPVMLEAGTQVFFDVGEDDIGELDLFTDGKLAIKLDLVGTDLAWMNNQRNFRGGFNISSGITTTATSVPVGPDDKPEQGTALVLSFTGFVEFGRLLKWQVGYVQGWGARESLQNRDDGAVVVGFSFSTGLGQRLVGIFKDPDATPQASRR
jgi:hypothetical protein